MNLKSNKKGFTLVELLLVIAIIGILAAVLFVSLGKQRERARLTTFKENVKGLVAAYTACTDGAGTIYTGAADGAAASCTGGPTGLGKVTKITDCDGEGNVAISSTKASGDTWFFQATCNTSGGTCIANCTADGCIFCNTALTFASGTWSSACAAESNCQ